MTKKSHFWIYIHRIEIKISKRYWLSQVNCSIIHTSQEMETIYTSTERWMDKEYVVYACMLSCYSRVWLCNPVDCTSPGFSAHGILQARIMEWVAMPSCRGSSLPRDRIHISYISCIGRRVLYHYFCCCSFAQSCPTLCYPMDWSMPGFPVLHHSPGACSNSCPLSQWCHPTISSSVIPFSSCLQSFPFMCFSWLKHPGQRVF